MTEYDNDADKTRSDETKLDAKEQRKQKIVSAYKGLKAQGFNKEQAAKQLSSKFAMTETDVSAALADVEEENK